MPISQAVVKQFNDLVYSVLDWNAMNDRMKCPWFRDFFSGYTGPMLNGLSGGGLADDLPKVQKTKDDDPGFFAYAGKVAGQEDWDRVCQGDRSLQSLAAFVKDWQRHKKHWKKYRKRADWMAHERNYAEFSRCFDDMIERAGKAKP